MKKIIHLSDLHVGHEDCGEKFSALVDNITFLKQPAEHYIIVITGDIVDNANHAEQREEAFNTISRLKQNGYTVLVIPGNHDYGTGSMGSAQYVNIFKEKFYGTADVTYPKLDIIGEIAFMGLDTTAEELHWSDRFLSEGQLGEEQLLRLEQMLLDPEVISRKRVVYLHHHPFDFNLGMQLRDSHRLKSIIEYKIDMLLFGHLHRNPVTAGKIFHGAWGIVRCYNAGSSTHKNGHAGFQRVIDLSEGDPRMDYDGNFI